LSVADLVAWPEVAKRFGPGVSTVFAVFALNKLQQVQEQDRAGKRAEEFRKSAIGPQAQEAEHKPAHQRADDAHDKVAHEAEGVTFDNETRQKSGGQSNQTDPDQFFHIHIFAN
jgi:hypothetical protein